jgi:sterol desaturase/sphingolipid hydroxylase (fatty acid hydroxylase superfamily)
MEKTDRQYVYGLAATAVAAALLLYLFAPSLVDPARIRPGAVQDSEVVGIYLNPLFWGLLASIFVLERLLPARSAQPILSLGLVQDSVYVVFILLFRVVVLSLYVKVLRDLYTAHLPFLTIESIAAWPGWAKAVIAIAVTDFLGWFHHVVRHKVPAFWRLHAIHHSQKELNIFADLRYHPIEYLITQTILFIPMFAFSAAFPVVLGYALFQQVYTKFYHGNIRTDLGPLRFVLVTPQSHRIHHSVNPEHHDKNYAVVFSIWDWMFGTQHRGHTEYPETGIDDPDFPCETTVRGLGPLAALWQQSVYPFKRKSPRSTASVERDSDRGASIPLPSVAEPAE